MKSKVGFFVSILPVIVTIFVQTGYGIEECPGQDVIRDGDRRWSLVNLDYSIVYGHPLQFHDLNEMRFFQENKTTPSMAINQAISESAKIITRDNPLSNMIIHTQLSTCQELNELRAQFDNPALKAYLVPLHGYASSSNMIGMLTEIDPVEVWNADASIISEWNGTSQCGSLYLIPLLVNGRKLVLSGVQLQSEANERINCAVNKADLKSLIDLLSAATED